MKRVAQVLLVAADVLVSIADVLIGPDATEDDEAEFVVGDPRTPQTKELEATRAPAKPRAAEVPVAPALRGGVGDRMARAKGRGAR